MAEPTAFQAFNQNSRSVRRIMSEYKELSKDKSSLYKAMPLEDNIFEWHFTIRGPRDTDFEGGIYHGRILLPPEYPNKPPDIVFLTPNGRFETDKKVCLTISSHHEETWLPTWGIRTVLIAIIAFMPSRGDGALASLDWTTTERKKLAEKSLGFVCHKCKSHNMTALPAEDVNEKLDAVPKELELRDAKPKAETPAVPADPSAPLNLSTSELPANLNQSTGVQRNPLAMSAPSQVNIPAAQAPPPPPVAIPAVTVANAERPNQPQLANAQHIAAPLPPRLNNQPLPKAVQLLDLFIVAMSFLLGYLLYKRFLVDVS